VIGRSAFPSVSVKTNWLRPTGIPVTGLPEIPDAGEVVMAEVTGPAGLPCGADDRQPQVPAARRRIRQKRKDFM